MHPPEIHQNISEAIFHNPGWVLVMSGSQQRPRFSLHTPAMVDITIVGYLDDSWSEQLGMSMDHATINDGIYVTVLRGELVDQAALFGVLNGLYGLGFPLVSVECEPRP